MKQFLGNTLLLTMLAGLPGCLAINAALGVMGLLGPPAVQWAGVAYTVSEYTYEYAANDRTPDKVLMAKIDWLLPQDETPVHTHPTGMLNATSYTPSATLAVAEPVSAALPPVIPILTVAKDSRPTFAVAQKPKHQTTPARIQPRQQLAAVHTPIRKDRIATVSLPIKPPSHTYVERDTDPLMTRMNRLENTLNQAEAMFLADQADGVRLSVSSMTDTPSEQGITGTWSIRHPLMKTMPTTGHSSRSDRSLNT